MIGKHESGSDRARDVSRAVGVSVAPTLLFLAALIAASTTIAARATIVRAAPATAAAYALLGMPVNLRDLSIDNVHATVAGASDERELLVAGEIVNLRQTETSAPNLRIAPRGDDGREIYLWTAPGPRPRLGPHERVAFRARLAAPPSGVRDVLVKFAAPGDKASFTE
jgi:hypothetical protein